MKIQPFISAAVALGALIAFTGCASNPGSQAQHADNAIDLAASKLGGEHQHLAPIEIVPSPTARIVNAHAVRKGEQTLVYGYLQPVVRLSRGSGAHVDVLALGPDGREFAHASDVYLPPASSRRTRGNQAARASFAVTLPALPAGSSLRIIHRGVAQAKCSCQEPA